jgi:ABC-type Fe3+-hydroxamate transport system substrate-binding protein
MPWIRIWPSFCLLFFFQASFAKEDIKVASASPSITQMIYTLGGANKLVARSDYCKDPAEVLSKPTLGSPYNFKYEKAKELGINLVISAKTSLVKFKQRLKQMNVELLELKAGSFKDMLKNMFTIAKRMGLRNNVINISVLEQQFESIPQSHSGSFLFVHAFAKKNGRVQGLYVSGKNSIYSDLLSKMGLTNASENNEEESHLLSLEKLLLANPKYIFWQDAAGMKFSKNAPFNKLTGQHIVVDNENFKVPGPILIKLPIRISNLIKMHERVSK